MTIKEICVSIITYDSTNLSGTLDAAIIDSTSILRGWIGDSDYMLYTNEASSLGITSITLDPDDDGSDILELVIDDADIHGMILMSGFEEDYTFLNNKVAIIQSGTSNGEIYKYIRFDTATDFDVEYVALTHVGTLTSLWYQDMQRAQAYIAVSYFVPMARRISLNTAIYVNAGYGDSTMLPAGIEDVNNFSATYLNKAKEIVRNYYVKKHNADNSISSKASTDLSSAKSNFGFVSFSS